MVARAATKSRRRWHSFISLCTLVVCVAGCLCCVRSRNQQLASSTFALFAQAASSSSTHKAGERSKQLSRNLDELDLGEEEADAADLDSTVRIGSALAEARRSFGTAGVSDSFPVAGAPTSADLEGDPSQLCQSLRELSVNSEVNVNDILSGASEEARRNRGSRTSSSSAFVSSPLDYSWDVKGRYFCGKGAPPHMRCSCGIADYCEEASDPWGRDMGRCRCCQGWLIALIVLIVLVFVGIIALGIFAMVFSGSWIFNGHPRPIEPLRPTRTPTIVAPAGHPLPFGAFGHYRSDRFDSGPIDEAFITLLRRRRSAVSEGNGDGRGQVGPVAAAAAQNAERAVAAVSVTGNPLAALFPLPPPPPQSRRGPSEFPAVAIVRMGPPSPTAFAADQRPDAQPQPRAMHSSTTTTTAARQHNTDWAAMEGGRGMGLPVISGGDPLVITPPQWYASATAPDASRGGGGAERESGREAEEGEGFEANSAALPSDRNTSGGLAFNAAKPGQDANTGNDAFYPEGHAPQSNSERSPSQNTANSRALMQSQHHPPSFSFTSPQQTPKTMDEASGVKLQGLGRRSGGQGRGGVGGHQHQFSQQGDGDGAAIPWTHIETPRSPDAGDFNTRGTTSSGRYYIVGGAGEPGGIVSGREGGLVGVVGMGAGIPITAARPLRTYTPQQLAALPPAPGTNYTHAPDVYLGGQGTRGEGAAAAPNNNTNNAFNGRTKSTAPDGTATAEDSYLYQYQLAQYNYPIDATNTDDSTDRERGAAAGAAGQPISNRIRFAGEEDALTLMTATVVTEDDQTAHRFDADSTRRDADDSPPSSVDLQDDDQLQHRQRTQEEADQYNAARSASSKTPESGLGASPPTTATTYGDQRKQLAAAIAKQAGLAYGPSRTGGAERAHSTSPFYGTMAPIDGVGGGSSPPLASSPPPATERGGATPPPLLPRNSSSVSSYFRQPTAEDLSSSKNYYRVPTVTASGGQLFAAAAHARVNSFGVSPAFAPVYYNNNNNTPQQLGMQRSSSFQLGDTRGTASPTLVRKVSGSNFHNSPTLQQRQQLASGTSSAMSGSPTSATPPLMMPTQHPLLGSGCQPSNNVAPMTSTAAATSPSRNPIAMGDGRGGVGCLPNDVHQRREEKQTLVDNTLKKANFHRRVNNPASPFASTAEEAMLAVNTAGGAQQHYHYDPNDNATNDMTMTNTMHGGHPDEALRRTAVAVSAISKVGGAEEKGTMHQIDSSSMAAKTMTPATATAAANAVDTSHQAYTRSHNHKRQGRQREDAENESIVDDVQPR